MPELTDTELIATRLLGWGPFKPSANYEHCRCYRNGHQWEGIRISDGSQYCDNGYWPDLTNWNDIHRMEDAIVAKSLWVLYETELRRSTLDDAGYRGKEKLAPSLFLLLRATAPQRVAACVKVLREVQG